MHLGHNSKIDLIKRVPLFAAASKAELAEIASIADEIDLPADKTLIKEGDAGHEFFVLVEGTASVERSGRRIADLGPGDFFGEVGLLEKDRRNATVVSRSPMRLITLTGWDLKRMEKAMPQAVDEIRAVMEKRRVQ
jgi:CRP/FNR family transcriptional regulator, cyclic AMP receptor protein